MVSKRSIEALIETQNELESNKIKDSCKNYFFNELFLFKKLDPNRGLFEQL